MIQPKSAPFTFSSLSYLSHKNLENHYKKYLKYIKKTNSYPIANNFDNITDLLNSIQGEDLLLKTASQIYNHEVFWNSLSSKITNPIKQAKKLKINNDKGYWGSLIKSCLHHFDSGWCWVIYDAKNNKLEYSVTSSWKFILDDQQYQVLFNIDLWEHSYYCDYGLNFKEYIKNIIEHLRWEDVQ